MFETAGRKFDNGDLVIYLPDVTTYLDVHAIEEKVWTTVAAFLPASKMTVVSLRRHRVFVDIPDS